MRFFFHQFLNSLQSECNISLFHYRNHGGDIARVLIGLQIPDGQKDKILNFLDNLGYSYQEETENPVYKRFLR